MNTPKTTDFSAFPAGFFDPLSDEDQAEFEDLCEYRAERAAILEYDAGYPREQAEREALRLTMANFPPSDRARAAIQRQAEALATHYGLNATAGHLTESRIRRLHVDPGAWWVLADQFAQQAQG